MKIKQVSIIIVSIFFIAIIQTASAETSKDLKQLTADVTADDAHYINNLIETVGAVAVKNGATLELYAEHGIHFNAGFSVELGGALIAVASPDSDGDLILDYVEKESGCLNFQTSHTDEDLLSDSQEDENRNGKLDDSETSPCSWDTDNDLMSDHWERTFKLDPRLDDAGDDADGDGLTNYMEYYFRGSEASPQSNPKDETSLPPKGTYYEYDELGRIKRIIRIK